MPNKQKQRENARRSARRVMVATDAIPCPVGQWRFELAPPPHPTDPTKRLYCADEILLIERLEELSGVNVEFTMDFRDYYDIAVVRQEGESEDQARARLLTVAQEVGWTDDYEVHVSRLLNNILRESLDDE